jgi:clan AA aspartic protease
VIRGQVTARKQAVVPLTLVDATGLLVDVQATVDTGFTGSLTLPPDLVTAMQLQYGRSSFVLLGDGSTVEISLHTATVLWDGTHRQIAILATEGTPLVGMSLLDGYQLFVDVVAGGEVRIEQRP